MFNNVDEALSLSIFTILNLICSLSFKLSSISISAFLSLILICSGVSLPLIMSLFCNSSIEGGQMKIALASGKA